MREHDADEREARADRIRRAHLKGAHYAADQSEDIESMRDALALGTLTAQHGKVMA